MPDSIDHLPATRAELDARGWAEVDVVIVTGDAHVDHPSFPAAILGRALEAEGWRVGVIPRPDPADPAAIGRLGRPRLFFAVTAGALDSMVANYTALGRVRSDDPYAPGGRAGGRPDRALTVYCNAIRRAFGKEVLVVAGGLEAGLRRFAHYDYWSDKVRRPILMDCGADLLVHGMGEGPVCAIAAAVDRALARRTGAPRGALPDLVSLRGVVYRTPRSEAPPPGAVALPPEEDIRRDPRVHATAFRTLERALGQVMVQETGGMRVVANPAWPPATTEELDRFYRLPFTRDVHPCHGGEAVPALVQVRFSVTSHRGCAGGCAFCAINHHQGKIVTSRSQASILDEVRAVTTHRSFRGTVPDIGGPTANMWGLRCERPEGPCARPSCLWPSRCAQLVDDQEAWVRLLRKARGLPGVEHLFVTTGIRMDLAMDCPALLNALADELTSGRLKVAPEHVVPSVLRHMRKPAGKDFERFTEAFRRRSAAAGRNQFVLPYLMAAHPGSRLEDMVEVALTLRRLDLRVEQCQIFTPTPGTAATVMYATGLDPDTLDPVHVERSDRGKRLQKALVLHHLPENRDLVEEALTRVGRRDLVKELLRGRSGGRRADDKGRRRS
ncbi:MAG: YgiQ family radical SAM protein [Pseudomonadota bacterium]